MNFILDTKIFGGSTVPELNYPLLKYAMFINNIQIIVQKNSVIEKYIYIEELHKILDSLIFSNFALKFVAPYRDGHTIKYTSIGKIT